MLLGEVEWGRKQEARESKTGVALFTPSELENTTYFFFTVLHHWQTVNIWLSCWGANFWSTLTTSHFYWPCLPFLKQLSAVIPLFRSPPAVFSSGVWGPAFWMKWIVTQWRWRWHLGRQVWWCPARKGGLLGISSSKPHRDTESSWSRWALLRCTFLHGNHGWSTEMTCPRQRVF